jgi:hypothetical protein
MTDRAEESDRGRRLVVGIVLVLLLPQLWVTLRLAMRGFALTPIDWVRPFAIVLLGILLYRGMAVAKWLFVVILSLGAFQYGMAAVSVEENQPGAIVFGAVAVVVLGIVVVLLRSSSIRSLIATRRLLRSSPSPSPDVSGQ